MVIKNIILIILIILITFGCDNERYLAYEKIEMPSKNGGPYGKSRAYKMKSVNGDFLIESIPYEYVNIIPGDLCSGVTKVYDLEADSIIYDIDRYFGINNTFFSEDGKTIVYVNDFWRGSSYDSCSNSILEFYKYGIIEKSYSFEELLNQPDDVNDFNWLYYDRQANEWLVKNNRYVIDNQLYIISAVTGTVMIFDMNTMGIIDEIDTTTFLNNLDFVDFKQNEIEFLPIEEVEFLPNLKNGNSFREELAKTMDLKLVSLDGKRNNERYYFFISIEVLIDIFGQSYNVKVHSNEDVLKEASSKMTASIKKFIKSNQFDIKTLPYDLDKWFFEDMFYASRNPLNLGKDDLIEYADKVCEIDSSGNVYIPKDLTDAHTELDKILDDDAKEQIKNGEPSHFGLGMWLRNNWGLWKGGRLKCYFDGKGLYHPDHISSLIIHTYQMNLNNISFNQDSIIQESSNAEKEWMKN